MKDVQGHTATSPKGRACKRPRTPTKDDLDDCLPSKKIAFSSGTSEEKHLMPAGVYAAALLLIKVTSSAVPYSIII